MDDRNENMAPNEAQCAEARLGAQRDAAQLKAYWEGVMQGREQASVIQVRIAALQLAHDACDHIDGVVMRARAYHAFLTGEQAAD